MRWTLPNILTLARICLTPVIALLPFIQGYWPKVIAFLIFLVDYRIPWLGSLPVWVALLLVGRELLMTAFRFFAKRRGVVIPAIGAGKLKAVVQNVFIGATLIWFAWRDALATHRWAGSFRNFWNEFHGAVVALTLAGAILLTVYSLVVYLYRYRALLKGRG